MDRKASDSLVTTIGIDIGKNTFHLVGLDERGAKWPLKAYSLMRSDARGYPSWPGADAPQGGRIH